VPSALSTGIPKLIPDAARGILRGGKAHGGGDSIAPSRVPHLLGRPLSLRQRVLVEIIRFLVFSRLRNLSGTSD
jgi:hypothetical protein